jgi:hypothetical protein
MARCRREIAAIEELIRSGHPDLQGLCLGLMDWSAELRRIEQEVGLNARKPAAAGAGRARKEEALDATGGCGRFVPHPRA